MRRSPLAGPVVAVLVATAAACTGGDHAGEADPTPLARQAARMLNAAVADLGRDSAMAAGKPSREAIRSYLDVVAWTPAGFGGPVLMRDTTDEPKITSGVVAGLERTIGVEATGPLQT